MGQAAPDPRGVALLNYRNIAPALNFEAGSEYSLMNEGGAFLCGLIKAGLQSYCGKTKAGFTGKATPRQNAISCMSGV
jgi:hypothetical protein